MKKQIRMITYLQRKQELLSVKGKNGKEKPLLHGCVCFHVAAVGAILIQLKFQSDKVELNKIAARRPARAVA